MAFKEKLRQLEEELSEIDRQLKEELSDEDKKLKAKKHAQIKNQIAAQKSRHNKIVHREQAKIELQHEKQKSAMRKLYINAIFEVMEEEFGDELHNKLTRKIDEKIRNKRSKLGLGTPN